MKMTREEYITLYEKYTSGKCTDEEKKALEEYEDSFKLEGREWDEELMGSREEAREFIGSYLKDRVHISDKVRPGYILQKWSVAAAVLVVISVGMYFFLQKPADNILGKNGRFKNDIKPGGAKAVLVLDDGSEIILDNAEEGLLAKQGFAEIKKDENGKLVYTTTQNRSSSVNAKYNTVSTPPGGEYQIVLPDGTKVWLNAASALKFPAGFTGKERKVELSGEAYFEVSQDKSRPFKVVLAKGTEVKVLGTHFNIMAYNNESNINTTLLEGSVEVDNGSKKEYLKPGQQATIVRNTGSLDVKSVNVENVIAWKNGYFIFKNENIQNIMRQISRWYDVEIAYEGNVGNKNFMGTISRTKNISELLNILELTETIHFKIEGRKVTVMP